MSTYRIALSIYSRSPAAYDNLRSWGIFKLPSRSSLKKYSTALLQKEGPYFEYIKDEAAKYERFKDEMRKKGSETLPIGEGVLILDEVKVTGKVIWNSKNGEMCGLAMDDADIVSAVDLSDEVAASEKGAEPAEYVLQFLWRDLSSNRDVIGPHYTSATSVTAAFTTACLHDAMHALQVYGFKVVCVVLDGASTNLSMVKLLSGYGKGAYGLKPRVHGTDHHAVQPWFQNPLFVHLKVYFVICPTHQMKNMINQLFASATGRAKNFVTEFGIHFGWKQIEDMYERECERARNRHIRIVPKLLKSYIDRDSWTKLNVKPAKIMQQEQVLAELQSHAQPDEGPIPGDHQQTMAAHNYLAACSKMFEFGFLHHSHFAKIEDLDSPTLKNIGQGFQFFKDWSERLMEQDEHFSVKSPKQTKFIAWQTYDLLRVCHYSFLEFCGDYLARHPGYYIVPLKLNGSAVETLFSQFKQSVGGKLTSVNYEHAKRDYSLKGEIGLGKRGRGERGYRDVELHVTDVPLKRKK